MAAAMAERVVPVAAAAAGLVLWGCWRARESHPAEPSSNPAADLTPTAASAEDGTRARWEREQLELKEQLVTEDGPRVAEMVASLAAEDGRAWLVAGVDIGFVKGNDVDAVASVVVVELPTLRRVCAIHEHIKLEEPYITGFLAFREAPHYARLLRRLEQEHPESAPVVVMVDGSGVHHPRGFGCACHIGVLSGIPTIGVAKKLQKMDGMDHSSMRQLCDEANLAYGESVPLVGSSGRVWGAALRSSRPPGGRQAEGSSFQPIFVSVGHGLGLSSALAITVATCKHRIPEPVRLADLEGRDVIRKMESDPPPAQAGDAAAAPDAPDGSSQAEVAPGNRTGLVYSDRMRAHHDPSGPHPESPDRISSIYQRLCESGLQQRCVDVEVREATLEELAAVHDEEHIHTIRNLDSMEQKARTRLARGYNSVFLSQGSREAAMLAAGSVTELTLRVAKGELANGVAVVRPPGHHAECGCAMGFSLFGNVAVAARAVRSPVFRREMILKKLKTKFTTGTAGWGEARADRGLGCAPRKRNPAHV